MSASASQRDRKERRMPRYRMVYGDDVQVARQTFDDVELEREDRWIVLFRGRDAIFRIHEDHVQSLEEL
jgi:hypothetical protein